ncbi:DUF2381 family protein [Archangium sp.]|uniref:DUF2381 family protein n=1 Tax=Archangium sp. TaxID=1872627 RepID=UPI00286D3A6C|nr:DUF2381 family protein [Archangium sp.]
MPLTSVAALLGLALSTTPVEASASPRPPECSPIQSIELTPGRAGPPPTVCVSPGQPTNFHFDAQLREGGLVLEERERFEDVGEGKRSVTLYPARGGTWGKPLSLEVCFADGAAPACATFRLVLHPGRATHEVRVMRTTRTAEELQREKEEMEARLRQLEEELVRTRAACAAPSGMTGLVTQGHVTPEQPVTAKWVYELVTQGEGNALAFRQGSTYRGAGRVAIMATLMNPGPLAWKTEGAVLSAPSGAKLRVLSVWQEAPLSPGASTRVVVEVEATAQEALGPHTLMLWGEDGRALQLGNVTFP